MSIQLKYQLEQRIDKAIKQLPYSQSKGDFVLTALNNYFDLLMRQRLIKQNDSPAKLNGYQLAGFSTSDSPDITINGFYTQCWCPAKLITNRSNLLQGPDLEFAKKALEPLKSNVKLQAIMAEFEARAEEKQDLNSLLDNLHYGMPSPQKTYSLLQEL